MNKIYRKIAFSYPKEGDRVWINFVTLAILYWYKQNGEVELEPSNYYRIYDFLSYKYGFITKERYIKKQRDYFKYLYDSDEISDEEILENFNELSQFIDWKNINKIYDHYFYNKFIRNIEISYNLIPHDKTDNTHIYLIEKICYEDIAGYEDLKRNIKFYKLPFYIKVDFLEGENDYEQIKEEKVL